jgi:hypothetical protein
VRGAFNELRDKWKTPAGRSLATKELQLCTEPAAGDDSLRLLALWVENAYANLGMLHYPWPNPNGSELPAWPMDAACAAMTSDPSLSLTRRLALSIGTIYNSTHELKCHNVSEEYLPCADITGCGGGSDPNSHSWDWQSCTEMVPNIDTNNVTDMFPPAPYDWDALCAYCQKTWGVTPSFALLPGPWLPSLRSLPTHSPQVPPRQVRLQQEHPHHPQQRDV